MADKTLNQLAIEHAPIASMRPDPRNPRTHSDKQIKQIAKSIETFGFNTPILVDQAGTIIAGHGRYLAGKQLNLSTLPVVRLEHLSPTQAKAFAIADNRLTEIAGWSDHLLGEIYLELSQAVDLDFSLDITGFSTAEIDLRIGALDASPDADTADTADELPPLKTSAVSQTGDLWALGRHRVYVGSALDPDAFRTVMGKNRAHMVFTDPPYNVKTDGHATGNGKTKHRQFAMASGEMTSEQFTDFLGDSFRLMARFSKTGAIIFSCMDWRHLKEVLAAGEDAFTELKNLCVWVKTNAGMGSFYRSHHEMVLVFKSGTCKHTNNIELGKFGRSRSNVWEYAGANSTGRHGEEGNLFDLHPTVKPVALVADAILDCSARGDTVLDPFLGSGSTLMAAERVGRHCYGIEIDPLYVDVAVRRWQQHSGEVAVNLVTGQNFADASKAGPR